MKSNFYHLGLSSDAAVVIGMTDYSPLSSSGYPSVTDYFSPDLPFGSSVPQPASTPTDVSTGTGPAVAVPNLGPKPVRIFPLSLLFPSCNFLPRHLKQVPFLSPLGSTTKSLSACPLVNLIIPSFLLAFLTCVRGVQSDKRILYVKADTRGVIKRNFFVH